MRKRFVGSLAAVMMLVVLALGTAASVAADSPYTCPDKSCSFSIPSFYSTLNFDDTSISFKDANSGGVVSVAVQDAPSQYTLDDLTRLLVRTRSQEQGYKAIGSIERSTLGGVPARDFTYQATNDSGVHYAQEFYVAVYQGQEYVVAFTTPIDTADQFITTARGVLDSWEFN